jgi:hypothetical protein
MVFNLRCEHLINRYPITKVLVGGDKTTTIIRHFCDAQRDELDNPIPINKCPIDCSLFEL